MAEKLSEVWENYNLKVQSVSRGRGMTILHTEQGLRVLEPLRVSESRLEQEAMLLEAIREKGYEKVDVLIRNQEGEYVTWDRYHTPYVMKEYYHGKECTITQRQDLIKSVENLARLHKAMSAIPVEDRSGDGKLLETLVRKNIELKRVRRFMRNIASKEDFHRRYLEHVAYFLGQGEEAVEQLRLKQQQLQGKGLQYCHGNYNQHHVLLDEEETATVHFEGFMVNHPLVDLYTLIRKAMEKNQYSSELLFALVEEYNRGVPMSAGDYGYLYFLLWYPEKFWKISNQYNNASKAWIPPKFQEKLQLVIQQESQKQAMLKEYRCRYKI